MNENPATTNTSHARLTPLANIRLESIRINGFRALSECCLTLEPGTTLLLGENNTGKTALLEALATALGARRSVDDDLHVPIDGIPAREFTVDLTVVPAIGDRFDPPVGTVFGTGVRRDGDDREYVAIRTTASVSPDRGVLHLRRSFLEGWASCADNPAVAAEIDGAPPVNDRVLRLLAFTLLDATRDLEFGLRRRLSHWGRLVSKLDIDSGLQGDIEKALGGLSQQIVDSSQVLRDIRSELGEVQRALSTVSGVTLAPLPTRVDELARAIEVLVAAPDGPELPLRMQGLGSRSLAEIMVFRAFAANLIGLGEAIVPQPVTVFEEPEAHLHPQAQVAVVALIEGISGQRLVSTHSPHLASVADIGSIRFFRRETGGIRIHSVTGLDREALIKVRRLVERPYGEVLFARLVIIGDGATERAGIPVFARAHWNGIECEGKCVSVVDPGSLSQAGSLVKVLEDLAIPWVILADGDDAATRALTTIGARIGRVLDEASPEVVMLPDGKAWEAYLLGEGLRAPMEGGIASFYGDTALDDFRAEGKNSTFGPDKLVLRFLTSGTRKGSHGGPIAEAIVAEVDSRGQPTIPSKVKDLLMRVDERLEVS